MRTNVCKCWLFFCFPNLLPFPPPHLNFTIFVAILAVFLPLFQTSSLSSLQPMGWRFYAGRGVNLRQLLAAVRNHRERHRCVNFHKAAFVFLLSNGNIGKLWPKIFLRKVNVHAIKLYRLIRNRIRNLWNTKRRKKWGGKKWRSMRVKKKQFLRVHKSCTRICLI